MYRSFPLHTSFCDIGFIMFCKSYKQLLNLLWSPMSSSRAKVYQYFNHQFILLWSIINVFYHIAQSTYIFDCFMWCLFLRGFMIGLKKYKLGVFLPIYQNDSGCSQTILQRCYSDRSGYVRLGELQFAPIRINVYLQMNSKWKWKWSKSASFLSLMGWCVICLHRLQMNPSFLSKLKQLNSRWDSL